MLTGNHGSVLKFIMVSNGLPAGFISGNGKTCQIKEAAKSLERLEPYET